MKTLVLALAFCLACSAGASAQTASEAADHDALRKLKDDIVNAINTRNLDVMDRVLNKPFMATVITQDSFNDAGKLKGYFNDLFNRSFLRIARITMQADADELSHIFTGTIAVARGGTSERYEMADGRVFDLRGRWTATAVNDGGTWKVLTIHTGTNLLDNPVLTAAEKSTVYFGAGGVAIGAVAGFLVGFFVRRRRAGSGG
jgi:hypothetical protein